MGERHEVQHHSRRWWAITLYIALVVTVTLALLAYQIARYGRL